MEASTIIPTTFNPDQMDRLMEFMGGVVGTDLGRMPEDVEAFSAVMCKHCDALVSGAEEKDAEGCFMVLFKQLQLEPREDVVARCVSSVVAAVSADAASKPALRLRILANLYNALSPAAADGGGAAGSGRLFLKVLLATIAYAGKADQLVMLGGYFDLLDDLVSFTTHHVLHHARGERIREGHATPTGCDLREHGPRFQLPAALLLIFPRPC